VAPSIGQRIAPLTKDLTAYESFDELWAAFETETTRELNLVFDRLDIYLNMYAKYRPAFLVSTMTHDCLERGRSMNDGGRGTAISAGAGWPYRMWPTA